MQNIADTFFRAAQQRVPNNPQNTLNLQEAARVEAGTPRSSPYMDWIGHVPPSGEPTIVPPTPVGAPTPASGGRVASNLHAPPFKVQEVPMMPQQPGPLSQVPPNPIAMGPGIMANPAKKRSGKALGTVAAKMQEAQRQKMRQVPGLSASKG